MKLILTAIVVLAAISSAASQPALFSGASSAPTVISKNIVSDYGATCNGIANDEAAFIAFNTAMAGQSLQVQLTIPGGSICCFLQPSGATYWVRGIANLLVLGTGATISTCATGAGFFLGSKGITPSANTTGAYTQSVSAGASCITTVTAGDASQFVIGRWAVMTAVDLQGFGNPPNSGLFEYVNIVSANAGTGQVCFAAALAYSYLSTYPSYNIGTGFELNAGGPAFLYPLEAEWKQTIEFRGLTIDQPGVQTLAHSYSVTYTNVTFTGDACGIPSLNFIMVYNNVTGTLCDIETDKLIETMTVNGGTFKTFAFQSSSLHTANFIGGANITTQLLGTPENTVCNGATITSLRLGASAYGRSKTFVGTNCVLPSISTLGFKETTADFSISSGVISWTIDGPITWAFPGSKPFFVGSMDYEGFQFTITSLSKSGSTTNVGTTLSGSAFPTLPLQGGTTLFIQTEPMPSFSCSGCTGSLDAVDYSQAAFQARPIYEGSNRIYTCAAKMAAVQAANPTVPVVDINSPSSFQIWGAPVSITAAVATADTSATTPLVWNFVSMNYTNTSGVSAHLSESVNLKTAGTRVANTSGVTGTQTGDILTDLSAVSAFGNDGSPFGAGAPNVSGTCPVVTVTLQANR